MDAHVSGILKSENINEELYYIAILDGSKCKSLKYFLKEIGKVFNFPSYYGENLNALYECLNDLEWLDKQNYFLLIKNSEIFLKDESTETRNHILSSLKRVAEEWANVPNYEGEEIYRRKSDFRIKLT
ncbi:MAG: barstar family protein [Chitinophagaceae bacterium]|nr:barstar family protein [Chitinophagaceae bacterium]